MNFKSSHSKQSRILLDSILKPRLLSFVHPGVFFVAVCGLYQFYKKHAPQFFGDVPCLEYTRQGPMTNSYIRSESYTALNKEIQDNYINLPKKRMEKRSTGKFTSLNDIEMPAWYGLTLKSDRSDGIKSEVKEDKSFEPDCIDKIPYMDEVEPEVKDTTAFKPKCFDDVPFVDDVEPEVMEKTPFKPKSLNDDLEGTRANTPQSTSSERTDTPSSDQRGESSTSSTLSLQSQCTGPPPDGGYGILSICDSMISRIPSFTDISTSTPLGSNTTLDKTLSASDNSVKMKESPVKTTPGKVDPQTKSVNFQGLPDNTKRNKTSQNESLQQKSPQKDSTRKPVTDNSVVKWVKNMMSKKSD